MQGEALVSRLKKWVLHLLLITLFLPIFPYAGFGSSAGGVKTLEQVTRELFQGAPPFSLELVRRLERIPRTEWPAGEPAAETTFPSREVRSNLFVRLLPVGTQDELSELAEACFQAFLEDTTQMQLLSSDDTVKGQFSQLRQRGEQPREILTAARTSFFVSTLDGELTIANRSGDVLVSEAPLLRNGEFRYVSEGDPDFMAAGLYSREKFEFATTRKFEVIQSSRESYCKIETYFEDILSRQLPTGKEVSQVGSSNGQGCSVLAASQDEPAGMFLLFLIVLFLLGFARRIEKIYFYDDSKGSSKRKK